MVGTRNVAFPRLNAFGYYVYLIGGLFLYTGLLPQHRPGRRLVRLRAALRPAVQPRQARGRLGADGHVHRDLRARRRRSRLIATIFKQRAPGMSLNRIPLFVWAMLVTSFMIIFAMPAVMLSSTHAGDRPAASARTSSTRPRAATRCSGSTCSGSSATPRSTSSSSRRPGSSRRSSRRSPAAQVFGYTALVLSLVATGFIGFGLWVHHMFATRPAAARQQLLHRGEHDDRDPQRRADLLLDRDALGAASSRFTTPLLFVLGFIVIFMIGGLTGVMLAVGAARPAGARHLLRRRALPLRADRRRGLPAVRRALLLVPEDDRPDALARRWAKVSFWLLFIGFNVTFFPHAHPRASRGCRAASTPTCRRPAGGT